jgi:hypothetical protein
MRTRYAILASILLFTACNDDPGGPGDQLLLGRFGDPENHAELLAIHAGTELNTGCGNFFSSDQPVELSDDGSFDLRGRWHFGGAFVDPQDAGATIVGQFAADRVTLTLHIDGRTGTSGDPAVFDLRRDVSVNFGEVLCAL